jgi:hypothetical protein
MLGFCQMLIGQRTGTDTIYFDSNTKRITYPNKNLGDIINIGDSIVVRPHFDVFHIKKDQIWPHRLQRECDLYVPYKVITEYNFPPTEKMRMMEVPNVNDSNNCDEDTMDVKSLNEIVLLPYQLLSAFDVETDNREMNRDFVESMVTISPISTFSFTKLMHHTFYPFKKEDEPLGAVGPKTFGLDLRTVPVINLGGKNWYGARGHKKTGNKLKRARWLQSAILMPAVDVRIFLNDNARFTYSLPVRTPNYLQGGAYYFTHSKFWRRSKPFGNEKTVMCGKYWQRMTLEERNDIIENKECLDSSTCREWYLPKGKILPRMHKVLYPKIYRTSSWYGRLEGHHHSDGQDGWNRANGPWDQDSAYWNRDGTINTYNGDFGLQVVFEADIALQRRVTYEGHTWYWIRPGGKSLRVTEKAKVTNFMVGFQFVPYNWIGIKPITERNLYATNRLNITYTRIRYKLEQEISQVINGQATRCQRLFSHHDSTKTSEWYAIQKPKYNEKWRFLIELTYLMDRKLERGNVFATDRKNIHILDASRRANLTITLHKRIRGTGNLSAFGQAMYYGSDPYNMYFMTTRVYLRCGIGWGFFIHADSRKDFE